MSSRYDPKAVEVKWQERWERQRAAEVDLRHAEGKEYLLVDPALRSVGRLDAGQGRTDILGDALFRFFRMSGRKAFSPVVKGRREQLRRFGILHDWTKEVDPTAPETWRWSQWLFARLLDKKLAYEDGGRWYLRVTAYADRLLAGLDGLPGWPARMKAEQRHWLTSHRRDWLVSAEETGGTPIPPIPPIPIVVCAKHGMLAVADAALPLSGAEAPCPRCAKPARRVAGSLDPRLDEALSSVRHLSPRDPARLVDPEVARRWLPVDRYLCAAGSAMLPLLHARFLGYALHDLGVTAVEEPFAKLITVGRVSAGPETAETSETLATFSADTQRICTLFLAPPEREAEWSGEAVAGAHRFLQRIWRLGTSLHEAPPTAPADGDLERRRQIAIERVTRSFERCRPNTAVAALMDLANRLSHAVEGQTASRLRCEETFDTLLQLLHPLAPHMTEELWERRDHVETLLDTSWPEYDENKLRRPRVRWAVQVDGHLHGRVEAEVDASEKEARAAALASPRIKEHLAGREVAKAVFVPGRLINLVTRRSA
jgi:leucyl-tRNA synthetase